MPDFNAKMQHNRFRLGLHPRPRWRSLERSPDPLGKCKGPTSKGRGDDGTGGDRKRTGGTGKGKGRGGMKGKGKKKGRGGGGRG